MSLEENLRALERTPVLTDLGRDALRLLAFSVEPHELVAGELLFSRKDPADGAYTIVRGRISLDAGVGDVRTVGAGALIGEMALLVDTERPCDAVAAQPSRVLYIPRPLFRRMLNEFPTIASHMRKRLLARMRSEHAALQRVHAQISDLGAGDD